MRRTIIGVLPSCFCCRVPICQSSSILFTTFMCMVTLVPSSSSYAELLATTSIERLGPATELPDELYYSFRMCEGVVGCSAPIEGIGFWEVGPLSGGDVGREFVVSQNSTTDLPPLQYDRLIDLLTNGSGDLFVMGVAVSPGDPLSSGAGRPEPEIFLTQGSTGFFRWNTNLEVSLNNVVDFQGFEINSLRMRIDAIEPGRFGMTLEFHSTVVPETSTLLLGALASIGLMLRRRCLPPQSHIG